jgi:hypothetical protein
VPPDSPADFSLPGTDLSSLDASTAALLDGLMEMMDGAVFVCDAEGTIVRSNEAAANFGEGSRPGQRIQELIHAPSPLDVQAPSSGDAGQTVEVDGVVDARSGEKKVAIQVRRSGPWQIIALKEPTNETDRWGNTPLPHETLRTLIETMRDPLASVRAAAETILLYPGMDAAAAAQFMHIIEEQTETLSERLDTAVESYARFYRQAGPLESIAASTLEEVVRTHLRRQVDIGIAGGESAEPAVGGEMRVRIDLQALTEAMAFLARRLENATRCTEVAVSVRSVRGLAALDLTWEGSRLRPDRLREWENDTLTFSNSLVEMTLADLVDHHDAQLLVQSDPNRVRLLLPTG